MGSLRVLHPRVHPIIISSVCPAECVLGPTGEEEQDLKLMEEAQKMTSVLPTMWLGAQNGW